MRLCRFQETFLLCLGRLGGVTEELVFSHKEAICDVGTYTFPPEAERRQIQTQQGIQAESITAMTIGYHNNIPLR